MHPQIDKKYRTEPLRTWELKSLSEKYNDFSFAKKSTWQAPGLLLLWICALAFILPFIPPRHGWSKWNPPSTIEEYQSRVISFLLFAPILFLAVCGYTAIRNNTDIRLGIKRIGNFRVTEVIQLGPLKILLLNGWRLFPIREKEDYYNTVNQGHIITIKRTGTYRLIDYYVRDEEAFTNEQKKDHYKIPITF